MGAPVIPEQKNFKDVLDKLIDNENQAQIFLDEIQKLKQKRLKQTHKKTQNPEMSRLTETFLSMKPADMSVYEYKLQNVQERKEQIDYEYYSHKVGLLTKWDVY